MIFFTKSMLKGYILPSKYQFTANLHRFFAVQVSRKGLGHHVYDLGLQDFIFHFVFAFFPSAGIFAQ